MPASGTLLSIVDRVAASAIQSGALHSIPTSVRRVSDGEWEFDIRLVEQLARKTSSTLISTKNAPSANPFLPYDKRLFVADIPPRHVCLLNKFNVVERHLLLVTREFHPQTSPLEWEDFAALANLTAEVDGLAFYNGGAEAGASQPHKHLQWVPVAPAELPFAAAIRHRLDDATRPLFPFKHYISRLPKTGFCSFEIRGREWWEVYRRGLRECGLVPAEPTTAGPPEGSGPSCDLPRELPPYNLLLTHDWLLLIPRSQESVAGISLNSLAFVGALLVRDARQMATLQELGPWQALLAVTCPLPGQSLPLKLDVFPH